MGKPKAKAKKNIEENEFLNDLIDEVKSIDNSQDDVEDDSLNSQYNILSPATRSKIDDDQKINPLFMDSVAVESDSGRGNKDSSDDLPTVFAHLNENIKAPKLRMGQEDGPRDESEVDASNLTTPSNEQIPKFPPETLRGNSDQSTSTAATMSSTAVNTEADRTIAVEGAKGNRAILQEKVATGALRGTRNGQVYTSLDASLAQSETLKIAQTRIKELEIEIDRLRTENDDLASAGDVVTRRVEDLQIRVHRLEKEKGDLADQSRNEQLILKGNLQFKDAELSKAKAKLDDLDMRIKSDFRKIRVRERELENRLELVRGEKQALMRAKDEKILDLQRRLDQYKSELDLYRSKVQDLNKIMENQHDQMQKTVRALRIALVNLEHEDSSDMQVENSSERDSEDQKKAK